MNTQPDHLGDIDDDAPVGRVLTRREVLAIFGVAGSALIASCAPALAPTASAPAAASPSTATPAASAEKATAEALSVDPAAAAQLSTVEAVNITTPIDCVVRPELTEGPYFVDKQLNRSDIRVEPSDGSIKEGTPLALSFVLAQVADNACTPLQGAMVDVWHCDAAGVYSGVSDRSFNTVGQKWLRGYQLTDATGAANFATIYPGWYSGRAVHIHFKIRTKGSDGSDYEFTSQLFFDEAITDTVHAQPPYAAKGTRDTPNAGDSIYKGGGAQLLLTPSPTSDGYSARITIALDLSDAAVGQSDSAGRGRP